MAISEREKRDSTVGIIRYMQEMAPTDDAARIVFIYNNAMDDAIQTLRVFADRNRQWRLPLEDAANQLERDFKLVAERKCDETDTASD